MQAPKMILFDYGHTLCYEYDTDFLRGERAVFAHVTENPRGVTPEEACALGTRLFAEAEQVRRMGYEVHEWPLLRLKYESLGLRFDVPLEELEIILANAADPDRLMPGVQDMLSDLRRLGIRTGVISNLGWSGNALAARLKAMLPEHEFEFILASSEYALRKPNPLLFQVALGKAGLPASDVWYIGDSIAADVTGAKNAGIFPILYQDETILNPWAKKDAGLTADCLTIRRWSELSDLLLKGGRLIMSNKLKVMERLRALNIPHEYHEHAPARTMEDCLALPYAEPDVTFCKNILLCNRQQTAFYLYVTPPDKPFRTADTSKALNSSRLSFAPSECLPRMLGLESGSLSPLGLWFDTEKQIQLVFDHEIRRDGRIAFHPCDNTATVLFDQAIFFNLVVPTLGHPAIWI